MLDEGTGVAKDGVQHSEGIYEESLSKDHACSRLAPVCAKKAVSTYTSFEVGRLN